MAAVVIRKIATLPVDATALTKHTEKGHSMPLARHLVTEEHLEGIYLFRYADNWQFAGDTWHQCMEDVFTQIKHEFGIVNLDWRQTTEQEISLLTTRK